MLIIIFYYQHKPKKQKPQSLPLKDIIFSDHCIFLYMHHHPLYPIFDSDTHTHIQGHTQGEWRDSQFLRAQKETKNVQKGNGGTIRIVTKFMSI